MSDRRSISLLSRILFVASLIAIGTAAILSLIWLAVLAWVLLWFAAIIQDRSVRR